MRGGRESSYWGTTPMGQGYAGHHERRSTAPRAVDVMVARERLGNLVGGAAVEVTPTATIDTALGEVPVAEGNAEVPQAFEQL